MPKGDGWHIILRDYFIHHALKREQAEECVTQVFLRYSAKADAPAWDAGVPPPLFWRLARDVLCEHFRQQQRQRQQKERMQGALANTGEPGAEMLAIDELDAERFANRLPGRLREVLGLRLQGYTCEEIAKQLSLSPGTVRAYLAELRRKFVQYYGYDPTKTPSCDGNVYGSLSGAEVSALDRERRDAHEEVSGLDGGRSVRGKRVRPAPHSRRARRARGGSSTVAAVSDTCGGCSKNTSLTRDGSSSRLGHGSEHGVAPLAMACYYQDMCVQVGPVDVYRCRDVFWPCDLFGPWHNFERGSRTAVVCPVKGQATPCVMYYECRDWQLIQCCEDEFNHCPPTNPRCSSYTPCPIGEP